MIVAQEAIRGLLSGVGNCMVVTLVMEPDTLDTAISLIATLVSVHGDYDDIDAWKKIINVLEQAKEVLSFAFLMTLERKK